MRMWEELKKKQKKKQDVGLESMVSRDLLEQVHAVSSRLFICNDLNWFQKCCL